MLAEKDVSLVLSRAWDKEKILSPHGGIEPQTHGIHAPMLYTEPQRLYGERGLICCEVLMKRVQHTARIGNIDRVMFVNSIREKVRFWAR